MDEKKFDSIVNLEAYLGTFGDEHLFRGQTAHYTLEDGSPSLSSSIARSGCIPPLMFKWTYYAAQALHSAKYSEFDRDLLQALLQHYGWRSFYIDLTNDYRVGCWFAGHKFSMKTIVDITQDCWNEDIYLLHDGAEFTATETEGHLYVLSKECIRKSGKNIFDLSRVDKQLALRPHLQRG